MLCCTGDITERKRFRDTKNKRKRANGKKAGLVPLTYDKKFRQKKKKALNETRMSLQCSQLGLRMKMKRFVNAPKDAAL